MTYEEWALIHIPQHVLKLTSFDWHEMNDACRAAYKAGQASVFEPLPTYDEIALNISEMGDCEFMDWLRESISKRLGGV